MIASRDRVAYAELRALSGKMRQPAGNARRQWRRRDGLLLRLTSEDGAVGLGEASPLPGYSTETLERCAEGLRQLPWEALSFALDEHWTQTPDRCEEGLRRLSGETLSFGLGDGPLALSAATERVLAPLPAAARCAVETALLDLAAQRRGVPLATLLRGETPAPVAVSALLTGESPDAVLGSARAAVGRGFTVLKLKLGRPDGAEWELAAVRLLRQRLGPAIGLRLDANRAWSLAEASERLAALAELRPELIEEPLADVRELLRLRSPVPIALDESLQHLEPTHELLPLLASGSVQALVLKPMALGGPLRCLQLARLGQKYGLPSLVTHLFDGTVALALAAAVALALPRSLACGLDAHAGLTLGPEAAMGFVGAPQIPPPEPPGLGMTLTPAQLQAPCLWSKGRLAAR